MVQNPTPKDETALLPLLRQDCSRVRSEGSTCATIQSNLTSWKSVWAWSDARAEARPRSRKFASKARGYTSARYGGRGWHFQKKVSAWELEHLTVSIRYVKL